MFRLSEYFYKYLAQKADRKRGGKAKLKAKRKPEQQDLRMRIYIPLKNNSSRKKKTTLPAAALPFTAADRNRNRTAQNFFEILLAIPYSATLQKISIFENAAPVRKCAHLYTQVCFENLRLNGTLYFSVPFKLGQSGSAALPLPRVPPFLFYTMIFFCVYIFHV